VYTIWTQPYKLLQCKKLIKSTTFVETKLGTLTKTQPKRDLKREDFRKSMLVSLSSKIRRFLSLQMLHIKRAGITFQIASLGCPIPCTFQQKISSWMLLSITHETPKRLRINCQRAEVYSQWMREGD